VDRSLVISIVVMLTAVAAAPVIATALSRFIRVPVAVIEMFLGLLIGPSILGLAHTSSGDVIDWLRVIGVVLLFFAAGVETNFKPLMGRQLNIATVSWLFCLVLAIAITTGMAYGMDLGGTTSAWVTGVFIGGAIVSTALGTIYPMVHDAGEITTKVGQATIASGVIGQFAPLIALAVLVGADGHNPLWALGMHILFAVIVAAALWVMRHGLPFGLARVQSMTIDSSGQFGVRLQALIVGAVVLLAVTMGVDRLIGAFAAGILVRQLLVKGDATVYTILARKVKGISYGFFIPMFFVWAGVTFDLRALANNPQTLWFIPVFVVLKLVVRGVPGSATLPKGSTFQERTATSLLVGTGLAVVIVMANLGLEAGAFNSAFAAAMMGGGKLTALLFPTIGLILANRARGVDPRRQVEAVVVE
jgi:Kef-type K+ transport system membrane component KefB